MSVGIAGFSTGIAIAKQATAGTLATTGFAILPAEDSDSLTHGQTYRDRGAAYGLRTQPASFYARDATMPGGDMPSWALGMDGSSSALLAISRMFFQSYTIATAAGVGTFLWTFAPHAANKAALSSYETWTLAKVTGLAGDTNEWYRDCMAVAMAGNWAPGEALTIKPTIQSLAFSHAGTPSGWGAAPTALKTIGAPNLGVAAHVTGSVYTLYPSAVSWNWTYNAEDIAGAGVNRARITYGNFSGDCSLTVPRNSDLYAAVETYGGTIGTIAIALRPTGNYASGGAGTLTADLYMYGMFNRLDKPAGPGGDITDEMTMKVQNVSFQVYSDIGSAAIAAPL